MDIWDGFLFNNELELLEIRLHELGKVVEGFVLVESPHTFQGKSKPLHFDEHKDWFKKYNITHVVSPLPYVGDIDPKYVWLNEEYARNQISNYFEYLPNTLALMSDADEIPARETIEMMYIPRQPVRVEQRLSYYYMNTVSQKPWYGTVIALQEDFVKLGAQKLRDCIWSWSMPSVTGGWHFSYLGGAKRIKEKLQSFSHTEYSTSEYTNLTHIKKAMKTGEDLFGRDDHFTKIEVDGSFPHLIRESPDQFKELFL